MHTLALSTNVAAFYAATADQIAITKYLRKQTRCKRNTFVYFDDADLVLQDTTIVHNALVNANLTMQDLVAALKAAL